MLLSKTYIHDGEITMSTGTATHSDKMSGLAVNGGTPVSDKMVPMIAVRIEESDVEAALGVLRSGMLAAGKNCLAFEEAFAKASGAKHALSCANGTCALQIPYEVLFERGDEVLVPTWTYIATVSMVVARGGIPIWVDADPVTYNIDVEDAARKVTSKTTAIACTHLYGNPVDIDAVQTLASKSGLKVIYDAAQAHLATYKGNGIGEYGDATTYSFYATKNMTTGEGGMVTTNDESLANDLRLVRSHGEIAKYTHDRIGYNYRMTDIEGAMGLSQLTRLQAGTETRRSNAKKLDAMIAQIDGLAAPTQTEGAESAYHMYAVRIDLDAFRVEDEATFRDDFCKALNAEGVGSAVHYPHSLTRQPVFERMNAPHQIVSDRLAKTLFCVPIHQFLDDTQVNSVGEALAKVADAHRAG